MEIKPTMMKWRVIHIIHLNPQCQTQPSTWGSVDWSLTTSPPNPLGVRPVSSADGPGWRVQATGLAVSANAVADFCLRV